jgi:hypothetical protein
MNTHALQKATAAAAMVTAALAIAPAFGQYTGSGAPPYSQQPTTPPTTPDYQMPNKMVQPQAGTRPDSDMTRQGHMGGVSLNTLDNPQQKLTNATVDDSRGATIGTVTNVQTASSGKVQKVEVSLTSGNKTVAIPARDLRFDSSSNTLNARMTRLQIENLPSV